MIEDIQDFNLVDKVLTYCMCDQDYREGVGGILEGIEPSAAANSLGAAGTAVRRLRCCNQKQYCVKLKTGLFQECKKLIPLQYTEGLIIELYLDSALSCVMNETAGENLAFRIGNVSFVTELVRFDPEYTRVFEQSLLTKGVKLHVPSNTVSTFKT